MSAVWNKLVLSTSLMWAHKHIVFGMYFVLTIQIESLNLSCFTMALFKNVSHVIMEYYIYCLLKSQIVCFIIKKNQNMLFKPYLYGSPCFPYVYLATWTRYMEYTPSYESGLTMSFNESTIFLIELGGEKVTLMSLFLMILVISSLVPFITGYL